MKIKKILFLILFVSTSISTFSQYEYPGVTEESKDENKKKEGWYKESKLFFGGSIGLSFGSYTYIEIAPIAGYKITPRFWAGLGPKYVYIKEKRFYETSVYGIKVFGQFAIFKNINETINIGIGDIFVYAENESLNIEPLSLVNVYSSTFPYNYQYSFYEKDPRRWVNITLIGGGLRFPIGTRAGLRIIMLWDISQNPYYSYSNPELRLSIDF